MGKQNSAKDKVVVYLKVEGHFKAIFFNTV